MGRRAPKNMDLKVSMGAEGIIIELGDVAWGALDAEGAAKVGRQLLELSLAARGLKGPLFIIEPNE